MPDQRGAHLRWVQLTVRIAGSVLVGIGYRIVVDAHPDMISR
ncbi:hypothetical protein [Rhodococcus sp. 21391]|nr:hypothetical protein [Rhodococcus sp. 21391]